MKATITDANFPRTDEGRVYHLGIKHGELANRIITVGDPARARLLAANLTPLPNAEHLFQLHSERGFLTITGIYEGVPMSIVAIGMGAANMDFLIREGRECVDGDMAMIRQASIFGSCGGLIKDLPVGSLVVPKASVAVTRNLDFDFLAPPTEASHLDAYHLSKPALADPALHDLLFNTLSQDKSKSADITVKGDCVNATADSFYSSQGRITSFQDHNAGLIESLIERVDGIASLEMETFTLLHLAAVYCPSPNEKRQESNTIPPTRLPVSNFIQSTGTAATSQSAPSNDASSTTTMKHGRIAAAAVQMIFASRAEGTFITPDNVHSLESWAGAMCLKTLTRWKPE